MPLISVIVPLYRTEKYLDRCLCSLQAQTLRDLEIILIDDGSPEGALCDEYTARNSQIQVIHQAHQGVGAARNAGLCAARGDYIAFVDSDDWAEPEFLETLSRIAVEEGADLAGCGYTIHHTDGWTEDLFLEEDLLALSPGDSLEQLLHAPAHEGYLAGKLFNRAVLEGADEGEPLRFDPELPYGGDQLFCAQYGLRAQSILYTGAPLYHRFLRADGLLYRYDSKRLSELTAREQMVELLSPLSLSLLHLSRKRYMYTAINLIIHAANKGQTAVIPAIRKLAWPRMWDFWHNPETTWKNKLRAFIVLLCPVLSTRIWYSLKEHFGLAWEPEG